MDINAVETFLIANNAFYTDIKDRKNFCEYCFQLFKRYINYKAIKQQIVTIFNIESEFFDILVIVKELFWWKRLFSYIGFVFNKKAFVYYDNI